MTNVSSESDDRTVNNTMRHQYRVLTDEEKALMVALKDKGEEFINLLQQASTRIRSRESEIARTKMEEAVMWAVKGLTL